MEDKKTIEFTSVKNETEADTREIIAADISVDLCSKSSEELATIDQALARVESELERYTSHADLGDYAFAVASGICAGLIDTFFVGEFSLKDAHEWGSEKTEEFVKKVAKLREFKGDDVKDAILYLAEEKEHRSGVKKGYHLTSDANMKDFGWTRQHHLRDFAHHASVTGLLFSMLTQFTGKCYGTDTSGQFIIVDAADDTFIGKDVPQKFLYGTIYWFFHLVSDMAGSGIPGSEGTGIPGPLLSLAKELSSTRLFSNQVNNEGNREFSVFVSKLFNGTYFGERDESGKMIPLRFDLRTEIGVYDQLGKMMLPVILNETLVKAFYMLRRFVMEVSDKKIRTLDDLRLINWSKVKPTENRTIDRMLAVASMTFTVADTADAAVRAAIESGGNYVLFAGSFVTRFNYVGAGRAAVAVVKEIRNEQKEMQLIHEKRLLMEEKTGRILKQLQEYKASLEELVSGYLAEDITAFLEGFDYMNEGFASGDSDLVIKGNVVIQRVLGREPQFANQEEFDDFMESDAPLQF